MHTFSPSTWETETGESLSLRPAWSAERVPGQPGLHRETLSTWEEEGREREKVGAGSGMRGDRDDIQRVRILNSGV